MIHISNRSVRRILTFSAVHPCEAIAPATLLNSLINLAHAISDCKTKNFASNKRNARESVRQIGFLRVFLEELRKASPNLPDSVVLGLSELHLTFQKIRYLLEDCTREGARLWMLMNSERVADHFRILARAISTALDVIPLGAIEVSEEVKEYVELATRQARKARFEVEPADKAAMKRVISVLSLFENGIVPDRRDLNQVLDYLGIGSWSKCNNEVKFLDSEITLEWLKDEKRGVGILGSLMGFMTYCRCVLYDVVDGEQSDIGRRKSSTEVGLLSCLNPDDFRCPISLEFMTDPVTVSTGHTYDRSSIMKWFRAGNKTCPKTGQKLPNTELVPNLALCKLIEQHCSENGISVSNSGRRNRTASVSVETLASERAMNMVAAFLAGMLEENNNSDRAAHEVRVLSKRSVLNRSCLMEAGIVPRLLRLLPCSSVQENAMAALLNLSKHPKSKAAIVENGGLELIVGVLNKGLSLHARQHAAGALFYLASIEEYRELVGEIPEAIPGLIELIGKGPDRGKKNALVSIFTLLMHHGNHSKVLAAGAVPALVNLLESGTDIEEFKVDSLAILAALAEKPDGTVAILRCRRALHWVVEVLESSVASRAGKEHCVSLLLALCMNGGAEVVAPLVESSSLMRSLYNLYSLLGQEGSSRASKKASALIRVLHEFFERRPSGSASPILPRERFVHVW
jgi:hypothetical protein